MSEYFHSIVAFLSLFLFLLQQFDAHVFTNDAVLLHLLVPVLDAQVVFLQSLLQQLRLPEHARVLLHEIAEIRNKLRLQLLV